MQTALLVIDVQHALFEADPRPYEADQVIARIHAMCARARAAQAPVFWIQHENADALAFGTAGWKLHHHLETAPADTLIRKRTPDAFLHTPLQSLLEQHGIRQVVIAGYASEFCVDTTVRKAAALGYEVVIAADAHTTCDKAHASGAAIRAHHNATLSSISSFGTKIAATPSAAIQF